MAGAATWQQNSALCVGRGQHCGSPGLCCSAASRSSRAAPRGAAAVGAVRRAAAGAVRPRGRGCQCGAAEGLWMEGAGLLAAGGPGCSLCWLAVLVAALKVLRQVVGLCKQDNGKAVLIITTAAWLRSEVVQSAHHLLCCAQPAVVQRCSSAAAPLACGHPACPVVLQRCIAALSGVPGPQVLFLEHRMLRASKPTSPLLGGPAGPAGPALLGAL